MVSGCALASKVAAVVAAVVASDRLGKASIVKLLSTVRGWAVLV
jgi:hypothetical protein